MPNWNPFAKEPKTISELQEENERTELQLSIAQKKAMMDKLHANGLSLKKDFGGSIKAVIEWMKHH